MFSFVYAKVKQKNDYRLKIFSSVTTKPSSRMDLPCSLCREPVEGVEMLKMHMKKEHEVV